MAMAAIRTIDGTAHIGIAPALAQLPPDVDPHDAAREAARGQFPESEGWTEHYGIAWRIGQDFPIAPYRLVWSLEHA